VVQNHFFLNLKNPSKILITQIMHLLVKSI